MYTTHLRVDDQINHRILQAQLAASIYVARNPSVIESCLSNPYK